MEGAVETFFLFLLGPSARRQAQVSFAAQDKTGMVPDLILMVAACCLVSLRCAGLSFDSFWLGL